MNKKYINLLIIIAVILLVLITFYFIFNYNKTKETNNFKLEQIEGFKNNDEFPINMIENGSFQNGINPKNYINHEGINNIIKMKNPSKSPFVLEQKLSNDLTFYELMINKVIPNSHYVLMFWVSFDKNIEDIDILTLLKIKMKSFAKITYNVVQNTNIAGRKWYLIQYNFTTDEYVIDKMNIFINHTDKLQDDVIYFAGISMYRLLADARNFIYNDGLICYLDGYQYESSSLTWHDLSGFGNDFFWSNVPTTDYTKGAITMDNMDLSGNTSNDIFSSTDKFTIVITMNEEPKPDIVSATDVNIRYILTVPGNNKNAFEIGINRDNKLILIMDNKEVMSNKDISLFNKSVITITCLNGVSFNIYQDGVNIMNINNINKFYFNKDKVILNKNKDLNVSIYGLLIYNRIINASEMEGIREYFITNANKNYNNPDLNNYQMDNTLYNNIPINTVSPYYKNINTQNATYEGFDDNTNNSNDTQCKNDCNKMCKKFLDMGSNGIERYKTCLSNCKYVFTSCGQYCEDDKNTNSKFCSGLTKNNKQPIVYKKNGVYYVYVFPNSIYAEKLNYSGEKSYGSNVDKARQIYIKNFPDAVLPPELREGRNNNVENCPFSVNQLNPCYVDQCSDVDWSVENYQDLKLNDKCKKAISNYCRINSDIDENCYCWSDDHKNSPACVKMRGFFENPNEYCSPNSFKIEDHPDFSQYIKKDNIPCWGCSI